MKKNIKDYVKSNHFFVIRFIYYRGIGKNKKTLKKSKFFVDLPFKKCYIIYAFDGIQQNFKKN